MNYKDVMDELEKLGKESHKKTFLNHGIKEPVFGVPIKDLKPLARKIKKDYYLSKQLYDSANYDAMYLAGMIADGQKMTKEDFEDWIKKANHQMISDYIIAIVLCESNFPLELSRDWIKSEDKLKRSCAWNCYSWLIGIKNDEYFNKEEINELLKIAKEKVHIEENEVKYSINNFVICVAISYLPLHDQAVKIAQQIGKVTVDMGKTNCKVPLATDYIQRAKDKNRIGFKRKKLRC